MHNPMTKKGPVGVSGHTLVIQSIVSHFTKHSVKVENETHYLILRIQDTKHFTEGPMKQSHTCPYPLFYN
jgi:hypothetical protein